MAAMKKALEIIEQQGEVGFTLRELAKAVQVSHTALYRHYSSKRALIIEIAEEGFKELNRSFAGPMAFKAPARSRLTAFGVEYIVFAFQRKGHYRAMYHQELRCGSELPDSILRETEKSFDCLTALIADSLVEGRMKKADPDCAARCLWASLHGFASLLIDGQLQGLDDEKKVRKAAKAHMQFLIT